MESKPAENDEQWETDCRRDDDDDKELVDALTLHDKPCMSY